MNKRDIKPWNGKEAVVIDGHFDNPKREWNIEKSKNKGLGVFRFNGKVIGVTDGYEKKLFKSKLNQKTIKKIKKDWTYWFHKINDFNDPKEIANWWINKINELIK
jgi:hypothetical protein